MPASIRILLRHYQYYSIGDSINLRALWASSKLYLWSRIVLWPGKHMWCIFNRLSNCARFSCDQQCWVSNNWRCWRYFRLISREYSWRSGSTRPSRLSASVRVLLRNYQYHCIICLGVSNAINIRALWTSSKLYLRHRFVLWSRKHLWCSAYRLSDCSWNSCH